MKKCMYMEVEGVRPKGRPRKTWLEVVKNDLKSLGLQVWMLWIIMLGGRLWGIRADPGLPRATWDCSQDE